MHKTQETQFMKGKYPFASANSRKIGGLQNYQSGGNLEKKEVNFERECPTP